MGGKKLKIFFPIFQKSTTTLNPYLSKLSNLQLSKMNSNFFTQLTATIEKTVIDVLAQHVRGFSQALAEKSEGKFTSEQVMEVWNTLYPEATISASTPAHAEAKSPTQRTKTDKTRQCEVKKTAGKDKGNPCGKNCVVGKDTCVAHTPKNSEPSSPASPASKSVTGDAPSIGSNEELAKLKVEDLKTLLRKYPTIEFSSKDRKQNLIDKLSEYRDSQSSKPRSQKTLEEAFSSPAPKVAQKATTPVEVKTSTPSASTSTASTPIGSDEELTKLKVVDLKALCRLHEVPIGSKDLKNDLIASLIKKRDSMVPTTKVEEKEKVTEEVEEVEEVEDQDDEFEDEEEEVEEEEVEEEEVDEVEE